MKRLSILFILFLMMPFVAAFPGDINSDKIVDVFDLIIVGSHFGLISTDPGWDPRADSNENGVIDIQDMVEVSVNIGNIYSCSADNECTSNNCECADATCSTRVCNAIECTGCKYTSGGGGCVAGNIKAGWDPHNACTGSLACDGNGDCQIASAYPAIHTIGVRTIGGKAEFYNRDTGKTFIPRGNNFIRVAAQLRLDGTKMFVHHSLFNRGEYNSAEVRDNLIQMRNNGYNVVRVFIQDLRVGDPSGVGLDPIFMTNVADFLRQAKERDIFVQMTNTPFISPNYYPYPWISSNPSISGINALYLTRKGFDARIAFMADFIEDLKLRGAPIEQIFAYELLNEFHFRKDQEPLSLTSGVVTTLTGNYDMSNSAQRNQMMEDGAIFYINEMRTAIREHDPTALVSVSGTAGQSATKIVPPMGRVAHQSTADFIDLHVYMDRLSLANRATFWQLPSQLSKPLIMGEFGRWIDKEPDVVKAASSLRDLQVESCDYGFGGWLLWTWDPYELSERNLWSAVDNNGAINKALAPNVRGDPCKTADSPAPNNRPRGFLGTATCENIKGWAVDMDTPSDSIKVHIYKDGPAGTGTFVTSTVANVPRSDVNSYLSIPGDHGFSLPLPVSFKDGQSHKIYAYGIDSSIKDQNTLLTKSPMTITCS